MKLYILKDFETFNEFPDKFLKVYRNSSYYFIKKSSENFVAKRKIDSLYFFELLGSQKLIKEKSYYDVKSGARILTTKSISNIDGSNEEFFKSEDVVEITLLRNILNIKNNDKYYLSNKDIDVLVNYEKENSKVYKKTPRKYYY